MRRSGTRTTRRSWPPSGPRALLRSGPRPMSRVSMPWSECRADPASGRSHSSATNRCGADPAPEGRRGPKLEVRVEPDSTANHDMYSSASMEGIIALLMPIAIVGIVTYFRYRTKELAFRAREDPAKLQAHEKERK